MARTHKVTMSLTADDGAVTFTKTYTANSSAFYEIPVAIGETDLEVQIAADVSAIAASGNIFIAADQDLTLEWNTNVAGQGSIALKANCPVPYNVDMAGAFPTSPIVGDGTDWTNLFVTNGSGAATTLYIAVLQDATP